MDFMAALRIVLRRWPVVLGGLAFTAVVALVVAQSVAPTYQAGGSAMIIAPAPSVESEDASPLAQNPFARFDAATATLAAVTVEIMNDVQTRERLADEGANPAYEIGQSPSGPVLVVRVLDPDPDEAIRSAGIVLRAVNEELDRRQAEAGAPEESRIRSFVVTEPTQSVKLIGARIRAVVAVAVVGIATSLSLAFIAEALGLSGWRRRDEALAPAQPEPGLDDPGPEVGSPSSEDAADQDLEPPPVEALTGAGELVGDRVVGESVHG